jgi:hypothetical protein
VGEQRGADAEAEAVDGGQQRLVEEIDGKWRVDD